MIAHATSNEAAATSGNPKVLVMMATYNGERYLQEQIDTIMAQKAVDVHLLISDDGSTDSTRAICLRNAESNPKIEVCENEANVGVGRNFMKMLYSSDHAQYDYFAFSDQDDFWLPEKLSHAIAFINNTAAKTKPMLYYSDIINVDANLCGGTREFFPFRCVQTNMKTLLMYNWAAGCTMVFNSAFCNLAQMGKVGEFPRMHDAWLHLIALSVEEASVVADLSYSGILRRITGNNSVGKRGFGSFDAQRIKEHLSNLVAQPASHGALHCAMLLYGAYGPLMGTRELEALLVFLECRNSPIARLKAALDPNLKMPYINETALVRLKTLLGRW